MKLFVPLTTQVSIGLTDALRQEMLSSVVHVIGVFQVNNSRFSERTTEEKIKDWRKLWARD